MKPLPYLTFVLVLSAGALAAQERTAQGNLPQAAAWAALQNLADMANDNSKLAKIAAADAQARALKIETCGNQGKLYAPQKSSAADGCIPIISPDLFTIVGAAGRGRAIATCPANTLLVACAGSRTANFADTCDEDSCGYIGAGPYGSNRCITTIDEADDGNTSATSWATCMKTSL